MKATEAAFAASVASTFWYLKKRAELKPIAYPVIYADPSKNILRQHGIFFNSRDQTSQKRSYFFIL